MILSASRDKTIIVWTLTRDDQNYGYPKKALKVRSLHLFAFPHLPGAI